MANQKAGPSQLWVLRYRVGAVASPLHRDVISVRRRSVYLKVQDLAAAISVAHAPQRKVSWPCSCDHRWSRSAAAQPLAGPEPSPWLTGGPKRAGGRGSALHTFGTCSARARLLQAVVPVRRKLVRGAQMRCCASLRCNTHVSMRWVGG